MQYTPQQINEALQSHCNSEVSTEPQALTTQLLMSLRSRLPEAKRATACILIDSKAYAVFIHDDDLVAMFDPISLHAAVAAGHMGVLLGMDMFTDSFHPPGEKILPPNRVYVMAADGTEGYGSATLP